MKKKMAVFIILLLSQAVSANSDSWKNRMYCYGGPIPSNFVVELKASINNDGTEREVIFQKNVNGSKLRVTSSCRREMNKLICNSRDIQVVVEIDQKYTNRGIWDAASYSYYRAQVTRQDFWGPKTEKLHCR